MITSLNSSTRSGVLPERKKPQKPILFRDRGQSNKSGNGAFVSVLTSNYPAFSGLMTDTYIFNASTGLFEQLNIGVNQNLGTDLSNSNFGTSTVFAPMAASYLGVPVHYVIKSVGSTGITGEAGPDWVPENEELFTEANTDLQNAMNAMNLLYGAGNWQFDHDDWAQGEDERFSPAGYEDKLDHFITASDNFLGFNAKYLIEITQFEGIKLEQYAYINSHKSTSYPVEIDSYVSPDSLHYDAETMYNLSVQRFNVAKSYLWGI